MLRIDADRHEKAEGRGSKRTVVKDRLFKDREGRTGMGASPTISSKGKVPVLHAG